MQKIMVHVGLTETSPFSVVQQRYAQLYRDTYNYHRLGSRTTGSACVPSDIREIDISHLCSSVRVILPQKARYDRVLLVGTNGDNSGDVVFQWHEPLNGEGITYHSRGVILPNEFKLALWDYMVQALHGFYHQSSGQTIAESEQIVLAIVEAKLKKSNLGLEMLLNRLVRDGKALMLEC